MTEINSILDNLSNKNRPEPGYTNFNPGLFYRPEVAALNRIENTIVRGNWYDSKFYKFFDVLSSSEHLEFPKYIIQPFESFKQDYPDFYEFVKWKISLEFGSGILNFLTGIKGGESDYNQANFKNKIVCIATDTNQNTKLIVFEIKYYAGYFIENGESLSFVYLSEKDEFINIVDDLEFVDDNNSTVGYYLSEAWESERKSLPEHVDYSDAGDEIQKIVDRISTKKIHIDQNFIKKIEGFKTFSHQIKGNHTLKENGCFGGFAFELSVSIENAGKEIKIKQGNDIDQISFKSPNFVIVNDSEIKLSPDQYLLMYYFVPETNRGQYLDLKDFKDTISRKGISDFDTKSEKSLRSSFERIKEKFEKEGFKNLIEVKGFTVCIHNKADK